MVATISEQQNQIVLSIPRTFITDGFMLRLMDWVRYLNLLEQSELDAAAAWSLSEEMKENWWLENRARLLAKIDRLEIGQRR